MPLISLSRLANAIVDPVDLERFGHLNWYLSHHGYAARCERRNGRKHTILLHREILDAPSGIGVDHVSRDRLDNRRENLRLCSVSQNAMNKAKESGKTTSKFKGVIYCSTRGNWRARIRQEHIGYFDSEIEAAQAYNAVAKQKFGDFALLNNISIATGGYDSDKQLQSWP